MGFLLRQIRKSKWYAHKDVPWLGEGNIQADALADLKTEDNALSVWFIEGDKTNLEDVVAALAAGRDVIANFDYALIDESLVTEIGIKVTATPGEVGDPRVRIWHRDLAELSGGKLYGLALAISKHGEKQRVLPDTVTDLVRRAVASGGIRLADLKPEIASRIQGTAP